MGGKMKKGIFCLVALFFILSAICSSAENKNLILNPDLEIDENKDNVPDHWNKSGANCFYTDEEKHSGKYSIGIKEEGNKTAYYATDVRGIKPGGIYFIKGWGKSKEIKNYARIWFYWLDKDGKFIGAEKPVGDRFTATTEWEKREVVATAPKEAKGIRILCAIYPGKDSSGTVWFDDFSVHEVLPPPEGFNSPGKNFMYNGGFEFPDPVNPEIPVAWLPSKPENSKSILKWEQNGFSGKCVSMENFEAKDLCFWYSQIYEFKAETFYTLTFYYRFNKKEGRPFLVFLPGGLKNIPGEGARKDLPTDWVRHTISFSTPSDVKPSRISFSLNQNTQGQKLWIDQVEIIEAGNVHQIK